MGSWSKFPVGSGWKRRLCLSVAMTAIALPFAASLVLAQEPPQRDERKRITHKMRMEAAKNRKQMIQVIEAKKGVQQGGSATQQQPGGAPLTPSKPSRQ